MAPFGKPCARGALLLLLLCTPACFEPSRPEPDLQKTDAGADAERDGAAGIKHAACALPLPAELPPNPGMAEADEVADAATCDGLPELVTCDPGQGCPYEADCLTPDPNARGVCLKRDYKPKSASQYTMLGYAQGEARCVAAVPRSLKQKICCDGLVGFDCRTSEHPRKSALGELCRTHEDCEPNLLCADTRDVTISPRPYGRCVCPGIDFASVTNGPECSVFAPPAPWGSVAMPLALPCVPAKSPGFVVEVVLSGVANPVAYENYAAHLTGAQVGVAVDSKNQLHVVASDENFAYFVKTPSGWTREVIANKPAFGSGLALDANDTPHVIGGADYDFFRYATRRNGVWEIALMGTLGGANSTQVAILENGEPYFTYAWGAELHYVSHGPSGFDNRNLFVYLFRTTFVVVQNTPTWFYADSHDLYRGVVDDRGELVFASVAKDVAVLAAETSASELLLAVSDGPDQKSTLSLARLLDGGLTAKQLIWSQDNPRFAASGRLEADLAVADDGTIYLAHSAPEGLILETIVDGQASRAALADEATAPALIVDHQGELHVFYHALDEVRHVFRGACPRGN